MTSLATAANDRTVPKSLGSGIYCDAVIAVVRLSSVTFVRRILSRLEFSVMFLRHLELERWPSVEIHRKVYGDRPRGTTLSEGKS